MRHLDLFSGIGGFSLAASWVWGEEHEIVSFCEIDPFCQQILKKHWPNAPIVSDIKEMKGSDYVPIDLLTGGFPCQPFSVAGKRKGKEDNRFLWPEMLRIISETKPSWIIGENVPGILTIERGLVLRQMLHDLEKEGYRIFPLFLISSCSFNSVHKRYRTWIIAYSSSYGWNSGAYPKKYILEREMPKNENQSRKRGWSKVRGNSGISWVPFASQLCRVDDGLSSELDNNRIKALGNAIVPQAVVPFMKIIKELL